MFYYLTRSLVCERLHLSSSASYRIFGAAKRIRSDYVLDLLNRTRHWPQEMLDTFVPDDLRTPAEIAALVADSGITERQLKTWTHRRINPPPFFRINSHRILFRESAFLDWLDAQSSPHRYIFGKLQYEHKREKGVVVRRRPY